MCSELVTHRKWQDPFNKTFPLCIWNFIYNRMNIHNYLYFITFTSLIFDCQRKKIEKVIEFDMKSKFIETTLRPIMINIRDDKVKNNNDFI